jgi:hydrogenase maturation factor
VSCHDAHCITCADEGLPMRVVAVDVERELALCSGEGGRQTVEVGLVWPVRAGDELLVHAGTALARLDGAPA